MRDNVHFFAAAHLSTGWTRGVRAKVGGGLFTEITSENAPLPHDVRHAIAIPGLPNVHSHAFQRGMAGLAETAGPGDDSFWTWREVMYRFVDRLTPDDLLAVAAMAQVEMLEGGFTRVGEFHYLHNDPAGAAYGDPAAMAGGIL